MPFLNKTQNAIPVYNVDTAGNQLSNILPAGTDRSGTIATANVAQNLAPANPNRVYLTVQNTSDTNMTVTESGTDASANNGYVLVPNAALSISTNRSVSIFCATAGKRFAATEL